MDVIIIGILHFVLRTDTININLWIKQTIKIRKEHVSTKQAVQRNAGPEYLFVYSMASEIPAGYG